MNTPARIVIVGAGECGAAAAAALRGHDFEGTISLIGDETMVPYERPPLSKAALVSPDEPEPVTAVNGERLGELHVDFVRGVAVTAIDRDDTVVRLADGRTLPYDRLLMATGARARPLPIDGGDLALTLRTYDDALALRSRLLPDRHVVIFGAGFIGLEVAASARQLGCRVTVLEAAPAALGRAVPPEIADVVVQRHLDEGVEIRFDAQASAIGVDGDRFAVEVAGVGEPLVADVVLAGIGAVPNIELAADAGIDCDNGVAVNSRLQTSDPRIYAAGDCAAAVSDLYDGRRLRLESWRNAYDHAATAAVNMLGGDEPHLAVPWFWSDQYDLGLQLAGLFDAASEIVARRGPDGAMTLFGLDDGGRLVAAGAVGTGTSIARDIRVAEKIIEARGRPVAGQLADPGQPLKQLLRSLRYQGAEKLSLGVF